ncbi:predicted protein [Coccidioides posadasii str. Silveira]|uniref:Predicted protein n=1 Tax=Coccidioides posadasii (strain RMSCC 757 / Silveira) TaxID=443226 RepID=E9CYC2_COCPS|nr:predicted protein [Coccidioides posadasii str. Silveira]
MSQALWTNCYVSAACYDLEWSAMFSVPGLHEDGRTFCLVEHTQQANQRDTGVDSVIFGVQRGSRCESDLELSAANKSCESTLRQRVRRESSPRPSAEIHLFRLEQLEP